MSDMFLQLFITVQLAATDALDRARSEEHGQGLVEYVGAIALVGLIFVALSGAAGGFATALQTGITEVINKVTP